MDKDSDLILTEKILAEQLSWYRLQRHDFMNHWQVVMGYLQLKQADKALTYLRGAVSHQGAEQQVGQIPEPYVSAILIGLVLRLRQEEISCEVELAEELKQDNFWQTPRRQGYAGGLYGYTTECLALGRSYAQEHSPLRARIVLSDDEGELNVSFELYHEENTSGSEGEKNLGRLDGKRWHI